MSSSCLSSGGRTYGFELIVKSPTTSSQTLLTTTSSSPSSTLSESSNSPLAISTRKPRTPRKRPNQIYNEAATLLSTAYPNIFSTKDLAKNPRKFNKPYSSSYEESSDLLIPFRVIDDFGTPLHRHYQSTIQEKPNSQFEQKVSNFTEIDSQACSNPNSFKLSDGCHQDEEFDAESMLDEEIEEGIIDSIMGNVCVNTNKDYIDEYLNASSSLQNVNYINSCYGYPMPMELGNFKIGFGINWGLKEALRPVDNGEWWRFPAVDMGEISPRLNSNIPSLPAKNKKKKKLDKLPELLPPANSIIGKSNSDSSEDKAIPAKSGSGLLLKLNFEEVLNEWSDRASPFSDDIQNSEIAGDVQARLAQIDLFLENGGLREASVLRYKEKRRTRLFSKKIRYQVRKVNADRRPRMKVRQSPPLSGSHNN